MGRIILQQQMFSLVEQWKASGKAKILFCEEAGIHLTKFKYWLRKYEQSSHSSKVGFVEITKHSRSAESKMEILFPNGVRLQLAGNCDPSWMRKLIGH